MNTKTETRYIITDPKFADLRKENDQLKARVKELESVVIRFSDSGAADAIRREDYGVMRERIKDWLGVSDFKAAINVMNCVEQQAGGEG